jgi:FG-GAP-like repeat
MGQQGIVFTNTTSGSGSTQRWATLIVLARTDNHDFNGNGQSDILWRDTSGNTAAWLMNGAAAVASAALGSIPVNWVVVGQRDFNGDGMADLLWRDSTTGATAL